MTALFQHRDTLRAARLGLATPEEKLWRGYGIESGTNDKVYLKGTSQEDIEHQAKARAYSLKFLQVWKVET